MTTVPELAPDTRPDEPTVAIAVVLVLHTPPGVPLEKITGVPIHISEGPTMAPTTGEGETVTDAVAKQLPMA